MNQWYNWWISINSIWWISDNICNYEILWWLKINPRTPLIFPVLSTGFSFSNLSPWKQRTGAGRENERKFHWFLRRKHGGHPVPQVSNCQLQTSIRQKKPGKLDTLYIHFGEWYSLSEIKAKSIFYSLKKCKECKIVLAYSIEHSMNIMTKE